MTNRNLNVAAGAPLNFFSLETVGMALLTTECLRDGMLPEDGGTGDGYGESFNGLTGRRASAYVTYYQDRLDALEFQSPEELADMGPLPEEGEIRTWRHPCARRTDHLVAPGERLVRYANKLDKLQERPAHLKPAYLVYVPDGHAPCALDAVDPRPEERIRCLNRMIRENHRSMAKFEERINRVWDEHQIQVAAKKVREKLAKIVQKPKAAIVEPKPMPTSPQPQTYKPRPVPRANAGTLSGRNNRTFR